MTNPTRSASSQPDPTQPDPTQPDPIKPDPTQPDPTRPETAAEHSGSADVSHGANTNLSPGDVSEAEAVRVIVEQHQTSGAQSGGDRNQPD